MVSLEGYTQARRRVPLNGFLSPSSLVLLLFLFDRVDPPEFPTAFWNLFTSA